MANELDELFDASDEAPRPATRWIVGLGLTGLLLSVLGLACSAVPGGVVILLAWQLSERELDRVESGYFPQSDAPLLRRLHLGVQVGLALVALIFVLQGLLFCSGFYGAFWSELLGFEGAL